MFLEQVRSWVAMTAKREGAFTHPGTFFHLTISHASGHSLDL